MRFKDTEFNWVTLLNNSYIASSIRLKQERFQIKNMSCKRISIAANLSTNICITFCSD